MTDTLSRVVVPYADFLERRGRRQRIAAELRRQLDEPPIATEAAAVAVALPLSNEQKHRLTSFEGPN